MRCSDRRCSCPGVGTWCGMLRNESLWLSPANPRQVSCPWGLRGIKGVLFLPSSFSLPPFFIFYNASLPLFLSLPPSILSCLSFLQSFLPTFLPPIPVSLDVLTEPSLCPLAHVPHPSFHERFLFCLCPEVMHRPGVGMGLQPPYSAGRRRGAGRGRGEGFDFHLLEES